MGLVEKAVKQAIIIQNRRLLAKARDRLGDVQLIDNTGDEAHRALYELTRIIDSLYVGLTGDKAVFEEGTGEPE